MNIHVGGGSGESVGFRVDRGDVGNRKKPVRHGKSKERVMVNPEFKSNENMAKHPFDPMEMSGVISDALKTSLSYYLTPKFDRILQTISRGHERANPEEGIPTWMYDKWPKQPFPCFLKSNPTPDIMLKLNDPTFVFLLVISQMKQFILPSDTDKCFGISATANSGHDPAPVIALQFLREYKHVSANWTLMGTGIDIKESHVIETGLRNNTACKNKCVVYNEDAVRTRQMNGNVMDWVGLGRDMFKQLMSEYKQRIGSAYYKHMFMHGCMHAQEVYDLSDKKIMAWGENHELWLAIMPAVEMAFVLQSLDDGGSTYIKIRNFRMTNSHFLAAVFTTCFDKFEAIPLPQQCAQSVILCCHGFKRNELTQSNKLDVFMEYFLNGSDSMDVNILLLPTEIRDVTFSDTFRQTLGQFGELGNFMNSYDNMTHMFFTDAFVRYGKNAGDLFLFEKASDMGRIDSVLASKLSATFSIEMKKLKRHSSNFEKTLVERMMKEM